ncbi:UvrD-helicase domain-containing protein [Anaerofustis butyriciformans]|uniref:UvrD-helicase domain-containing protein n=1 Tax=Anaerofustis TaxID=264995 RepID=UPI003F8AE53A
MMGNINLVTQIEDKKLDEAQIECVNSKERNILAIAGAGCGKTTTILARIKYLIQEEKIPPEQILVLSFTNSSTDELIDRISKITKEKINVCTFHKLGKDIIDNVHSGDISIYKDTIAKFVNEYIDTKLKTNEYFEMYDFIINYYQEYIDFIQFENKKDEQDYLFNKGIISLDNEYKTTFEENVIANYLYLNKIEYEYFNTNIYGNEFKKLCSGFYLTKYDKFIFNININSKGEKPLWGYPKIPKIAYKNYDAYIEFLHNYPIFKNKAIFTYSYDFEKGIFKEELEKKLKENNIDIKLSYSNVGKEVHKLFRYNINFIKKLTANFITLMKTTARDENDILNINNYSSKQEEQRAKAFFKVVLPIYKAYQKMLKDTKQMDFNDMILTATEYVKTSLYKKGYKHILIDEFQDISYSRMSLINEIYKKHNSHIFAVGDDYQSIFRFTGSDINIFYDFEKEYNAKKYFIEKNYRFDRTIANVTNKFILKNPYQIKKTLKSSKINILPINFVTARKKSELYRVFLKEIYKLPKNSEVMLLGRYKKDIIPYAQTNEVNIILHENNEISVILEKRKDLKIKFLTVHKAKGLECDYVFILNTFNSLMGFPCNITDDKLIKMLLKNKEDFPYSEERRLFYVALTRAKKKIFLMVNQSSMSGFVKEIMEYKKDSNIFL